MISLNTSPPVRRRPRWSGSVVPVGGQCGCGARRLLSMASAVVTLIVKGGRSAMSDVAGLDLLPPQRRGCRYGLCRSCTAQHDLGHSSTCRPLSPFGLASDQGLNELECGSRLGSEAAPAAVPLRPRSTRLSGRSSSPWRLAAPYRRAHSPRRTTGPRRPLRIAQTDTRSP